MVDGNIRLYRVENPPFHFSRGEDLDLCNMHFDNLGVEQTDIVLFGKPSLRSLRIIQQSSDDWKGLRILRDPRQALVSDYFHHAARFQLGEF